MIGGEQGVWRQAFLLKKGKPLFMNPVHGLRICCSSSLFYVLQLSLYSVLLCLQLLQALLNIFYRVAAAALNLTILLCSKRRSLAHALGREVVIKETVTASNPVIRCGTHTRFANPNIQGDKINKNPTTLSITKCFFIEMISKSPAS